MNTLFSLSAACAFLAIFSFSSHAATVGPVYPAPGGNSWVNTGGISAASGTAVWSYSAFDVTGLTGLYFGLDQLNYGPAGAGLSGTADPFVFSGVSGQTATWTALTTWDNPNVIGTGTTAATTRLRMTITGLGGTPWITDLASVGLDDTGTFGALGAVADNSAGLDFDLTWDIMADTGGGYIAINSVQQPPGPPYDQTRSSVATGFYSTVPVPAAAWLFGSAMVGLFGVSRRKRACS